jgi:hypothetical protein
MRMYTTSIDTTRLTTAVVLLLTLASFTTRANEVGVNAHRPTVDQLDALAELGVEWVRVDANWLQLEPNEGQYAWGEMDRIVDEATARGLKVMMTLAYAPAWASSGGGDNIATNDVPRPGTYARFVEAAVRHYTPRGVRHFGIWNEPNLPQFWEGSLDQYVDLVLRPGADAVRNTCADCLVLGPDLAGVGPWRDYLAGVLERAGDAFDIIAHHNYSSPQELRRQWVCDDFAHSIDSGDDVVCFYKPGLRQVLDQAGWQGQVWITETGYRADPWDSADEQQRQVTYARVVLEKQLATPWWTNTFFYELTDCRPAQPDCPIDGYGLTRRVREPDETWADNFVVKPVFHWLRDELADNPAWREDRMPPPEREPRITTTIEAPRRPEGAPDGALGDWDDDGCVVLTQYETVGRLREGGADLSARACAAWSAGALWLSVDVEDEQHANDRNDDTLWQGDSVQFAIDVDADGGEGYDEDDREVTVALSGGVTRLFAQQGRLDGMTGAVVRSGQRTRYELRIAVSDLSEGDVFRASFLVNDADGDTRDGWLEWTTGIGRAKRPADFGTITLTAHEAMPDPNMGLPPAEDAGHPPTRAEAEAPDAGASPLDGATVLAPDQGVAPVMAPQADAAVISAAAMPEGTVGSGCRAIPHGEPTALFGLLIIALCRRNRPRAGRRR